MGEGTERVWLVERSYGADEDLVTLVYATADGELHLQKQLERIATECSPRGRSMMAACIPEKEWGASGREQLPHWVKRESLVTTVN